MSASTTPPPSGKKLAAGRRQFQQVLWGSLATCTAVAVIEALTWNAPGFFIGFCVLSLGLVGIFALLFRGHSLRWLLFAYLLLLGAYAFLLGGLHMGVFDEDPVDPLCYVLAAAGLGLVGMGGYTIYSAELEEYLRSLVKKPG